MKLGIVIVHYHTPGLVGRAVEALRSDLQTSGLEGEILVVDNGSDASARAYLGALPVRYIDAGRNRGYAGGFNLGAAGTDAEILMLMNPDVLVLPGCLGWGVSLAPWAPGPPPPALGSTGTSASGSCCPQRRNGLVGRSFAPGWPGTTIVWPAGRAAAGGSTPGGSGWPRRPSRQSA